MDYQTLINGLDSQKIIELLLNLGAETYEEKEKYIIFPTICHNEDASQASRKLYYYKDNKFFVCYTECGSMSIFRFLKHYYETRNIPYDWHNDILRLVEKCSNGNKLDFFEKEKREKLEQRYIKRREEINFPTYSNGLLDTFIKAYPIEWLSDGITKQAMDKFNIRFSPSQNKIIIPHYNINGQLIGIRGRALDPWEVENIGKYMPVKIEGKWYSHQLSFNLYGLDKNLDNIRKNGVVFVAEAEKSVLQAESFSRPNCTVAVCGSNFNKYQLHLLLKSCDPKEIVICFDNEEKRGEDKYFNKLATIAYKYSKYCKISFIYDSQHLTKLKDSPFDNGEDVFNKLLEQRIRIE